MQYIKCIEDNTLYGYPSNITPYKALSGFLYSLNMQHEDKQAVINKSGRFLWFEHLGKTYCIKNGA